MIVASRERGWREGTLSHQGDFAQAEGDGEGEAAKEVQSKDAIVRIIGREIVSQQGKAETLVAESAQTPDLKMVHLANRGPGYYRNELSLLKRIVPGSQENR